MPEQEVEIVEVGARDGLQNEPEVVPTATKIALIERLVAAGARRIEVASFVHPKRVPQMADAEAVVAGLPVRPDVTYIGLVLNERGLERALATRDAAGHGIDEIGLVAVAADGFGRANQGMDWQTSVESACRIARRAAADGMRTQATVSVCWGDPFEGEVPLARVIEIVTRLAEAGLAEIALADTIGVAVPVRVTALFERAREAVPNVRLRAHFHNTRNMAIANCWAAHETGVRVFDASLGGLGGCPFAPKATGNVATEDVVYLFERSGIATGLDLEALIATNHWLTEKLGRPLPSMVGRAGGFPQARGDGSSQARGCARS
ncbi:MAG: hydroxymethylglutaryl-CoA lyase [Alphaproteobacteria bacterium]|nr:MAG: hydroxymethylglutaryl-CoA lyase [Alphaproteobacteria bacterium]